MSAKLTTLIAIVITGAAVAACSPARMAADLAGKAMAGGGDVYASEEDPELLIAALPFGLKTMEGLITSSPGNTDLRLAAGRGSDKAKLRPHCYCRLQARRPSG